MQDEEIEKENEKTVELSEGMTHDELIDKVAREILEKYRRSFEELAK
ncbi:MAG: hypothetical protein J1G38_00570 [Clostridiales bacterium]|nr:hypothetical protein [Clostridiales bacterium]